MKARALTPHAMTFPGRANAPAGQRVLQFVLNRMLLLPLGAVLAIIWANLAAESYFTFSLPIRFAVNDIAMALFFGLLTQEILEEVMPGGALHTWRRWTMPIVGAIGGSAGAVFVFLMYVGMKWELVLQQAWPVACAIDVVAAYWVLRLIRPRRGVLAFAVLMAIAADVIALAIIAQRHSIASMTLMGSALILLALAGAATLRHVGVTKFWPYLVLCGTASWAGFYLNGLQPALALVPLVPFLPHEPRTLQAFPDTPDDDQTHHVEHEWNVAVQVVLFFFGLVNAGVLLNGYGTGTWALLAAALAGRPLGMLIAVDLAVLAGLHLPEKVSFRELVIVAFATSSGFTMALFFAVAIMPMGPVLAEIKIGALSIAIGALVAFFFAWLLGVGRIGRARRPHTG